MKSRPLNWLDGRLLKLQRPTRPWSVLIEIDLHEAITAEMFEGCLAALLAARPELSARLGPDEPLSWTTVDQSLPGLTNTVTAELDHDVDLATESALRVGRSADGRTISWIVNHSFTDGLGLLQCIDDFLRIQSGNHVSKNAPVADTDLDSLVRSAGRLRSAADLIPRPRRTRPPISGPTKLETRHIPIESIQAARADRTSSINDLLVALLHRTIRAATWSRNTVVVGVPVDLRRIGNFGNGLGNAVVNANATIHRDSSLQRATALTHSSLKRQTSGSAIGARLGLVKAVTSPGRPCESPPRGRGRGAESAMLSNLGAMPDCPHWTTVSDLRFAPPAHELISVGVATIGDHTSVTFRAKIDRLLLVELADEFSALLR